MDISSEMIHALLPLYLTVGLGASALWHYLGPAWTFWAGAALAAGAAAIAITRSASR